MTAGGDFIPGERDFETTPNYPTIFGLKLSPTTGGVLIALAGLLVAGYILVTLVKPVFETSQQLNSDIADKERQIANTAETKQQIQTARNKLQATEKLKADVLTLFASNDNMDTLLLDLNERVQSANAGITDPTRRATLSKFALNPTASGTVTDASYGAAVNNKLQRRVFDVEMQGSFAQTQSIIRSIERLQPLLVVRNFKSNLNTDTRAIVLDDQGRLAANAQPIPRLTTGFQLIALIPIEAPAPAPAAPGAPAPESPAASPAP